MRGVQSTALILVDCLVVTFSSRPYSSRGIKLKSTIFEWAILVLGIDLGSISGPI